SRAVLGGLRVGEPTLKRLHCLTSRVGQSHTYPSSYGDPRRRRCNPCRVGDFFRCARSPRVARASQPWAERFNPFGIASLANAESRREPAQSPFKASGGRRVKGECRMEKSEPTAPKGTPKRSSSQVQAFVDATTDHSCAGWKRVPRRGGLVGARLEGKAVGCHRVRLQVRDDTFARAAKVAGVVFWLRLEVHFPDAHPLGLARKVSA